MVALKTGTWVVVADGAKALFLRNALDARDWDLRVVWHRTDDNPPNRAQSSDRAGRAVSGPGTKGAALQETDWHQLAEDRFADEVAAMLNHAARDGAFEEVVIVAAPAVLGELRSKLNPDTARAVVAEVPKTLTNHPLDRIEAVLRAELDAM